MIAPHRALLAAVSAVGMAQGFACSAAEQTLYGLPCYPGPSQAFAGVAMGRAGNLFGASFAGGATNVGAVFELVPPAGGGTAWSEDTLYSFGSGTQTPPAIDATSPQAAVLVEANGTLIGTGFYSNDTGCGGNGCGAIYTMAPPARKSTVWTEHAVYDFQGGADGANPEAGLIADGKGNFYGTTENGGSGQAGTVFALSPPAQAGAAWTEVPIFAFANGADGGYPVAPLVMDAGGALYGTTPSSGIGAGVVFKLSPPAQAGGAWTESVLYTFGLSGAPADGDEPEGPVIFDARGALYGTTLLGGQNGRGAVFRLEPPGSGQTAWTETTLYSFADTGDGALPIGPLRFKGRILYGAAEGSGRSTSKGVAFKLTPAANGATPWKEKVLYSFSGGADGEYPVSGVILDKAGDVFGTTLLGGPKACGAVFEVTP